MLCIHILLIMMLKAYIYMQKSKGYVSLTECTDSVVTESKKDYGHTHSDSPHRSEKTTVSHVFSSPCSKAE